MIIAQKLFHFFHKFVQLWCLFNKLNYDGRGRYLMFRGLPSGVQPAKFQMRNSTELPKQI